LQLMETFKIRCAAIILIAAGYGWAGGHYIPANSGMVAYLFQFLVIGFLLLFGIRFFSRFGTAMVKNDWSVRGLSIFAALSFLINILNIVHGIFNTDANSFGSHNTFADLVPIIFILAGSGLWMTSILKRKVNV